MQFNSYLCILVVVPAFVACYFLAARIRSSLTKAVVIAFGAGFCIYGGWESAAVLGVSLILNLLVSFALIKWSRFRKPLLVLDIVLNAALLFYYKYYNFALTTVNGIWGTDYKTVSLILPLGISFFTFQQIMYVVSVYRKNIPRVRVSDYLSFSLFFPKLVMGPLAEPKEFIDQLNNPGQKKIRPENIACGIKLFSFGLFKKMVLADTFARGVSWGYTNLASATAADLFLVMLFYAFEIYFDFSGYCDMATGISKMVNITLPMNFDSPYKALSIRDFWKRWHITLTGFLTKYIYYPLGGSRKGKTRTYANILLVFLISGLWHGANWTFVLWGLLHGLLQVAERIIRLPVRRWQSPLRFVYTFLAVSLLWLLFRADSIAQWGEILAKMFSFRSMAVSDGLIQSFILPETAFLVDKLDFFGLNNLVTGLPMLVITVSALLICLIPKNNYRSQDKISYAGMILCAAVFVWAFLCLSTESVFVYAGF